MSRGNTVRTLPPPKPLGRCAHCNLPLGRDPHGNVVHATWPNLPLVVGPVYCSAAHWASTTTATEVIQ